MTLPEIARVIPTKVGKNIQCPHQNVFMVLRQGLKNVGADGTTVGFSIVVMDIGLIEQIEPVLPTVLTDPDADFSSPTIASKMPISTGKGDPLKTGTELLLLLLLCHTSHPFWKIAKAFHFPNLFA